MESFGAVLHGLVSMRRGSRNATILTQDHSLATGILRDVTCNPSSRSAKVVSRDLLVTVQTPDIYFLKASQSYLTTIMK